MKLAAVALTAIAAAVWSGAGPATAQEPLKAFDQLRTRLRVGDTIVVVDASLREHTGRLVSLTPTSLVLSTRPDRPFDANQVREVMTQGPHPFPKGLMWGAGLGTAAGLAWALSSNDSIGASPPCPPSSGDVTCHLPAPVHSDGPDDWAAVFIGAGAGAVTGLVVARLIPGRRIVVYRAPPPGRNAGVRLAIAPIITPRTKGVAVTFAF
jgi:hypothetical protein